MKIEVWSDFACPYCYIGEARLQKAIDHLQASDKITLSWKSFELDPTAPKQAESVTVERFAEKYGLSKEEAQARVDDISQMGRGEGLDFRYATTRYTNTFDAMRLAKYGVEQGHPEIIEALFAAYFTANEELADHDTLRRIAGECGLDGAGTEEVLNSDRYGEAVRRDEREAGLLGIRSVPYFLIDKKYVVSGAQPTEMWCDIIADRLQKDHTAAAE